VDSKLKADLHIHTNYSDGIHTPRKILTLAAKKDLSIISITDHDTIFGCAEAIELAPEFNIEVIPGVELSTYFDNDEIHLLAYLFDMNSPAFTSLLDTLYDGRLHRARRICKRLTIIGIDISIEEVLEVSGSSAVGRPHIASVLVKKGFAKNFHDAFNKYLAKDSPCYVAKENLRTYDAIKAVHDAGGVSFVAHPGMIDETILKKLVRGGLNGVEVIHPSLKARHTRDLKKFVKSYELLESGGSDYHGGNRNDNSNFGAYFINTMHVSKMKKFLSSGIHEE